MNMHITPTRVAAPPLRVERKGEMLILNGELLDLSGVTANAITLTYGMASLVTGQQVRFVATSANTGAATINLDGLGAVACRTITGAALPSGYIRAGIDTVATYDGTYWVLDRQIERGSNASGAYVRFADGTQNCWTRDFPTASSAAATWTFPASFVNGTSPTVFAHQQPAGTYSRIWVSYQVLSTECAIRSSDSSGNESVSPSCSLMAIGRWF